MTTIAVFLGTVISLLLLEVLSSVLELGIRNIVKQAATKGERMIEVDHSSRDGKLVGLVVDIFVELILERIELVEPLLVQVSLFVNPVLDGDLGDV